MFAVRTALCVALVASVLGAVESVKAETLDGRFDAADKAINRADEMFNNAKKGHLPSLETINDLQARIELAEDLLQQAREDMANKREYDAAAKLDAAEFLADQVYSIADH